jgi:Leucine-rich repeat (LRR) protein
MGVAASTDKLDLTECNLERLPGQVRKLPRPRRCCTLALLKRGGCALLLKLAIVDEAAWAPSRSLHDAPQVFELPELLELSAAGKQLAALPAAVGRLELLQRLGLAGNRLRALPDELCGLQGLQGLWAHGNMLRSVPEGLGALHARRAPRLPAALRCSALDAGRCLAAAHAGLGDAVRGRPATRA